jgi:hypothetical protein
MRPALFRELDALGDGLQVIADGLLRFVFAPIADGYESRL